MVERKPSVGERVHYVSHGSPVRPDGTQAYTSVCRAAEVTEISATEPWRVGLCVINPTGLLFHSLAVDGCGNDETEHQGGTWHWPEAFE